MRLAGWAVLWTALVALTCAPAFAQGAADGNGNNPAVQYVDCSQVQAAVQNQYGNANADADNESEAVAEVAQKLNISQEQVNACLGNIGDNGGEETTEETTDEETTVVGDETIIMPDELGDKKLPDTGGPGGIALAAGCALLGVGLILNRIVR